MKVVICDECAEQAPLDPVFASPPRGWIDVRVVGGSERFFCSTTCAVVALNADMTTDQKPMLVQS